MKIYNAAIFTSGVCRGTSAYENLNYIEKKTIDECPNILESYHYINKQSVVDTIRNNGHKIFLDSGAFSAYTLGVSIDLPTYCDYIKRNLDIIRVEDGIVMASVLDGIGDALLTYQNQKWMESLGVKPIPCFHVGEDERYLEYYIKNYEYLALGGMVGVSDKQLCIWLDRIWRKYLLDGKGYPKIKVHGFGITSYSIMKNYPWQSVDSSTWIQLAKFGNIVTPNNWILPISKRSPKLFDNGKHVLTYTDIEKDYIFKMIKEQGFDSEKLSINRESRAAYNIHSFIKINEQINKDHKNKNFKIEVQELF